MSIKKEFCNEIFAGRKMVELRKNRPLSLFPCRVFVYESGGCGMVVGEFVCYAVERMKVESIWRLYSGVVCVSRVQFDEYYSGRDVGCAWHIRDVRRYETPVPLSVFRVCRPPQSWSYLRGVCSFYVS